MREFQVRLQSVLEVQEFVSLATARPFTVTVGEGNNTVNGKSFMEMFCLDLRRPLTVRADCDENGEESNVFLNDIRKFLI